VRYTSQGSQVYCVSLDASKAFDRVIRCEAGEKRNSFTIYKGVEILI